MKPLAHSTSLLAQHLSIWLSQCKPCMQASILLFHGSTLEAVRRIESSAAGFTALQFCRDGSQLLAATCDCRLLTYTIDGKAADQDPHLMGAVHLSSLLAAWLTSITCTIVVHLATCVTGRDLCNVLCLHCVWLVCLGDIKVTPCAICMSCTTKTQKASSVPRSVLAAFGLLTTPYLRGVAAAERSTLARDATSFIAGMLNRHTSMTDCNIEGHR